MSEKYITKIEVIPVGNGKDNKHHGKAEHIVMTGDLEATLISLADKFGYNLRNKPTPGQVVEAVNEKRDINVRRSLH